MAESESPATGQPPDPQVGAEPEAAVRVVRGNPSDEELAALIAALAAVRKAAAGTSGIAGSTDAGEPAGLSAWGAYWYRLGQRPRSGTAGWRASALPR